MRQNMTRYRRILVVLAILPVLAACGDFTGSYTAFKGMTAGVAAAMHGLFEDPDVNLREKNYAVADYLAGRIDKRVSKEAVILAQPLEELDHPGITSPLGMAIPEGVGVRMNDLGYNVKLHDVAPAGNRGLYPVPTSIDPAYILKGVYNVQRDYVTIHLQLVDTHTKGTVQRFDYDLLATKEVRELAKTPARIYRVYDDRPRSIEDLDAVVKP